MIEEIGVDSLLDIAFNEDELLEALRRKDGVAIEALFDRYSVLAYSLAYRMLGERQAAEDAVQEAFVNVWRYAGTYDAARSSVRSWLMTIVRNRCLDKLRAMSSRPKYSEAVDVSDKPAREDVWREVSQALTGEAISTAVAQLPIEQRQTIELAYFGGLSQTEIAEHMNVPLGTVKGRIRIGLQRLRNLLAPLEPDYLT